MKNEGLSKAKEIGGKIFKSSIFWYSIIAIVIFYFGRKVLIFFGILKDTQPPATAELPADYPSSVQDWWRQTGRAIMQNLDSAIDAEGGSIFGWLGLASKRRLASYNELLGLDKYHLTVVYNTFNKTYFGKYEKSMTKLIDSQSTGESAQTTLVNKLISYNLP